VSTTHHDHPTAPLLATEYFDGQRPVAQAVTLRIDDGDLLIEGPGVSRRVPRRQLRWPERQRHGARMMYLPQHGLISHADGAGWDAWTRAQGLRDPWVVRWMQSWRGVLWAVLVCVLLAGAAWQWGVPWASRLVVAAIPASVDQTVGEQALASFDREGLSPSKLRAPGRDPARIRRGGRARLPRRRTAGLHAALPLCRQDEDRPERLCPAGWPHGADR
jgi:hypothetical protein